MKKTLKEYIENFDSKRDSFNEETLNRLWRMALHLGEEQDIQSDRLTLLNHHVHYFGKSREKEYIPYWKDPVCHKILETTCLLYRGAKVKKYSGFYCASTLNNKDVATGIREEERDFIEGELDKLSLKLKDRKMSKEKYFQILDSSPEGIFTSLYLQYKMGDNDEK